MRNNGKARVYAEAFYSSDEDEPENVRLQRAIETLECALFRLAKERRSLRDRRISFYVDRRVTDHEAERQVQAIESEGKELLRLRNEAEKRLAETRNLPLFVRETRE